MADTETLSSIISAIEASTRKPEDFLGVQDKIALDLTGSIKSLYDFTKEQSQRNSNALPELLTEGFDEEQIWQQLELQNEGELVHFLSGVSKVLAGNKKLTLPISTLKPAPRYTSIENLTNENQVDSEDELSGDDQSKGDSDVESSLRKRKRASKTHKKSIVDDKFFKLQELDEYLTNEDRKEKDTNKNDDKSDEESVDLFNDLSENEDEDKEDAKFLKYTDFFDSPESEEEGLNESKDSANVNDNDTSDGEQSFHGSGGDNTEENTDDEEENKSTKRVKFNLANDSDETDSTENKRSSKDTEIKSSLEERQERLQKRIQNLEEAAISEKPWQLKGEVSASSRPQNSLLEEFVEFDVTTRPAPVITEQTTQKLEDIIRQRIKDKAWDDVEKKFKPVETPLEYKKKLILDQEKSKQSLAQIYENEYLKQKQALNPDNEEKEEEEPKLHTEIREAMHSLFCKLDALSNFHFTPKPAKPELKVISNIPAVNMEEVAPVATSDAALLAPEEVKEKQRGDLIGKAERTKTDMKRARRQKKLKQRERQKAKEMKEKLDALKPTIAKKYKKEKSAALMKKLTNDRNITKLDETQKAPKSSTAFFTQLQDQVKSQIKTKTAAISKNKNKNALSAVKLKL